jgi:hypothetical protein
VRHRATIAIAAAMLLAVIVSSAATAATSPFSGRWTSTDPGDGSFQVLLISAGSAPSVTFEDYYASSCANHGSPATHWVSAGGGEVDGDTLYVSFHKSGCGSFSIGAYEDWYTYDAGTDTLTDSFGIVWERNP